MATDRIIRICTAAFVLGATAFAVLPAAPHWTAQDVRMAFSCGGMRALRDAGDLGPADAATEAECTRLRQAGLTPRDIAIGKCFEIYNGRTRAERFDDASNAEADRKMRACFDGLGR